MVNVEERRLRALDEYGAALADFVVDEVRRVRDEGAEAFDERRDLSEDLFGVERRAAVAADDEVGVLDVALDARAQ